MIELPDFAPLSTSETSRLLTRSVLDALDHVLVVAAKRSASSSLAKLPYGKQLAVLLARAPRRGETMAASRATNARATGITLATFGATTRF